MGDITCQTESIAGLWPELLPIAAEHWAEVNPNCGAADIDCRRYEEAERNGVYYILTLRYHISEHESQLIGYASFWVSTNPQQKTSKEATQDSIYLRPEWRKGRIFRLLLVHSEHFLQSLGVSIVRQLVRRAVNFGPALMACGYEPIETTYEKRI